MGGQTALGYYKTDILHEIRTCTARYQENALSSRKEYSFLPCNIMVFAPSGSAKSMVLQLKLVNIKSFITDIIAISFFFFSSFLVFISNAHALFGWCWF